MPAAAFNLGVLLTGAGRVEEAEAVFRRAAAAGDVGAANNLGILLAETGRVEEAETVFRQAPAAGHVVRSPAFLFGNDPSAMADRVLKRGRGTPGGPNWVRERLLLPFGHWDELGRWHRASAWTGLQRTVRIALRRSTDAELVDVLSGSVHGVDDVGRLAAWRLWQLINARKDAHGYGDRRRTVAQAGHVTRWDHTPTAVAERARTMAAQAAPADFATGRPGCGSRSGAPRPPA
ncbi:tetratricopeptide repeat protein [Streptomyces sp. NPDC048256]|uniref:tetratricopeptide repeat protein n=1 Tax=Streptomyces sp. NPDC048256 TaxID=3154613 RepID=UPI0033C8EE02